MLFSASSCRAYADFVDIEYASSVSGRIKKEGRERNNFDRENVENDVKIFELKK